MSDLCPCCSGLEYNLCCQPFLNGEAIPQTPEALMRSRYTGYAKQDVNYLVQTWHPSCNAARFRDSLTESFASTRWLSLQIIGTETPDVKPEGYVSYFARYVENGREGFIHERSRFLREAQRWYYIDGTYPVTGRNDRCPCGSGKKFKKCCGQ